MTTDQWTISGILSWTQGHFEKWRPETPRLDAELLLAFVLGCSRLDLYLKADQPLNQKERKAYRELVQQRADGCPIAYLIGEKEFWSLNFLVDKNVLTPRPETEIMIETALNCPSPFKILDLGTGSGVLAIVMAKKVPDCEVVALEIDPKALSIAKENAKVHGVDDRVEFIYGDLKKVDWRGKYSMILSNPPYIPSVDIQKIMPEVKNYEPLKALDGGLDGLDFYRDIIPKASDQLEKNGYLILEIGHSQAGEVTGIFENSSSYNNIQVIPDYSGYDRVIKAQRKSVDG